MTYETPAALRAALEDRLGNRSRETGVDLQRLRRRAAFERLLVRLELGAPRRWIVKGGMALEVRLGDRARSTRDLDLALRGAEADGAGVRELLITCLSVDREEDRFEFFVGEPTAISPDEAGRPGWRFSVESRMGGRGFASVRLEVVARADEISKTQRVELPGVLDFAGLGRHEVEVVDPTQHFAEKVHAFTRSYGDRPNTRVRDLPDIVLLIDEGLGPTPELLSIVTRLFEARATHDIPTDLPDPPSFWRENYPAIATDLDVSAKTLNEAMALVRDFWTSLLQHKEED
ncbi:MAG: nucleotidyl transferase AbiEii/AbiGii toxin family protein [Actinobacteria bacterium]|nr:nucleotidyl transferase AbiEii/AbiGii toxin family protein [Actinomycetota bacterium]